MKAPLAGKTTLLVILPLAALAAITVLAQLSEAPPVSERVYHPLCTGQK